MKCIFLGLRLSTALTYNSWIVEFLEWQPCHNSLAKIKQAMMTLQGMAENRFTSVFFTNVFLGEIFFTPKYFVFSFFLGCWIHAVYKIDENLVSKSKQNKTSRTHLYKCRIVY